MHHPSMTVEAEERKHAIHGALPATVPWTALTQSELAAACGQLDKALSKVGRHKWMISDLTLILDEYPYFAPGYLLRGLCLAETGNAARAGEDVEKYLELTGRTFALEIQTV